MAHIFHHFITALRRDCAEDISLTEIVFNFDRRHTVRFVHTQGQTYYVFVRVNREGIRVSPSIRREFTKVSMTHSKTHSIIPDMKLTGEVIGIVKEYGDFGMTMDASGFITDRVHLKVERDLRANILPEYINNDMHHKLEQLSRMCAPPSSSRQGRDKLPVVEGSPAVVSKIARSLVSSHWKSGHRI